MTHYVSRGTLSNCSLIEASLVGRFFHSFLTPYNQRLNECVVLSGSAQIVGDVATSRKGAADKQDQFQNIVSH